MTAPLTDEALADHFARFTKVYAALGPYRRGLFREAAERTAVPGVAIAIWAGVGASQEEPRERTT